MTDDSVYSTSEVNLQNDPQAHQMFNEQLMQEDFELVIDFDDYSN